MLSRSSLALSLLVLLLLLSRPAARAADPPPKEQTGHPVCVCKPVTKDVKKTVYYEKCVPYCQSGCNCCLCRLCCRKCDPPRYKRVLMKKEIVVGQKCETQCVLEYESCEPACVDGAEIAPGSAPRHEVLPPPAPRGPFGHPADRP